MYDEWRDMGEASGLMALKQTEYYDGEEKHLKILEEHPDVSSPPMDDAPVIMAKLSTQFVICDRARLPAYATHSVSFTSITMTPLIYLNRLLDRLSRSSPGNLHRHHVPSLTSLSAPSIRALISSTPLAVIVCTGLGALTLGGLEDPTMFPTRGQVIKVRAPWIREGYTRQLGSLNGGEGGERTYVIPRPDGEVILGGTREVGDWYPYPREDTTRSILRRAGTICPHLVPPNLRAPATNDLIPPIKSLHLDDPTTDDETLTAHLESLIISTVVGFRPSRTDGVRLERGPDVDFGEQGVSKVVYNYGHGGAGWQSCWGCAEDAVGVLVKAIGGG